MASDERLPSSFVYGICPPGSCVYKCFYVCSAEVLPLGCFGISPWFRLCVVNCFSVWSAVFSWLSWALYRSLAQFVWLYLFLSLNGGSFLVLLCSLSPRPLRRFVCLYVFICVANGFSSALALFTIWTLLCFLLGIVSLAGSCVIWYWSPDSVCVSSNCFLIL